MRGNMANESALRVASVIFGVPAGVFIAHRYGFLTLLAVVSLIISHEFWRKAGN